MEKENTESIPKPQLISEAMQAADSSSDEVHSPGKVEGKPCLKMVTAETSPRNAQELDFFFRSGIDICRSFRLSYHTTQYEETRNSSWVDT
eukprot:TRINITY_DN31_c0_g2_i2.p4 TRINITY_DN31_c0_g2~~TRINITY_DN31_c0_g2_i2.p4  ORF type:complete len:91 (+),score=12.09 TRINITY_DN31_c0_g2_i2:307-579(+)